MIKDDKLPDMSDELLSSCIKVLDRFQKTYYSDDVFLSKSLATVRCSIRGILGNAQRYERMKGHKQWSS